MKSVIKSGILISAMVIVLLSCNHKKENDLSGSPQKRDIETTLIKEMQLSREVTLPGELKPWNKVNIMARVNAYANKVLVDRGDQVTQGQILCQLEAPELVAQLNAIKGNVAAAQARVIETESRLKASSLTYNRMLKTSETAGAVSANELDLAYSKMMADSALTTSARSNLIATQAQLSSQQQLVNYLTVSAPFDGVIIERNISPGALVGTSGNQSVPLFVLEDQTKLRLTVAIPENMANSVKKDSEVSFTVMANPGETFTAKFGRSASSLEEMNRSMPTEFDAMNPKGTLKAGMYAEVAIPLGRNKSTTVVPTSSLITTSEGVYIIRVDNSKMHWVDVKKGNQIDSQVEIFGDVRNGETIVLYADPEMRNGQDIL